MINTYALGNDALRYPQAATELARVTLGTYTPVQRPGDIGAILQGVTFASVEDVVFANLTTGELSTDVHLNPDGRFDGFVPVQEGRNRVRVTALASDGSAGAVEFDLEFRKGGLTEREKEIQLRRMQEMSRELLLRREGDQVERFREQQRKDLELRRAGDGEALSEPAGDGEPPIPGRGEGVVIRGQGRLLAERARRSRSFPAVKRRSPASLPEAAFARELARSSSWPSSRSTPGHLGLRPRSRGPRPIVTYGCSEIREATRRSATSTACSAGSRSMRCVPCRMPEGYKASIASWARALGLAD